MYTENSPLKPPVKWRLADVVDFEYLLDERFGHSAAPAEPEPARKKGGDPDPAVDREVYLAYTARQPERILRRGLFRLWLSENRKKRKAGGEGSQALPGEAVSEALAVFSAVSAAAGFLLGAGVCSSLLAYAGEAPINVFTCLWVILAPQLLLLALLAGRSLLRPLFGAQPPGALYPLLRRLLQQLMQRIGKSTFERLGAARRDRLTAAFSLVGRKRSVYGRIFFRPVFIAGQGFGIFYNAGIAGTLFLRVLITDLAFGWQSTLQPAAETVHQAVRVLALPWSWAVPASFAYPTEAQIRGSQFVYKEGIAQLASPDMTAWWPFLLLAILVYGLLPRLLLLAGTAAAQKRDLNALSFAHAACDRLLLSMQTPRIETASRRYAKPPVRMDGRSPAEPDAASEPAAPRGADAAEEAVVFAPEEIDGSLADDELAETLSRRLGLALSLRVPARMDPAADMEALQGLPAGREGGVLRLILVQEAWQPPIRELLSWISAMRSAAPETAGLIVGLIGKPGADSLLTPPAETDRLIWANAVDRIGDPYIRVEVLGG